MKTKYRVQKTSSDLKDEAKMSSDRNQQDQDQDQDEEEEENEEEELRRRE